MKKQKQMEGEYSRQNPPVLAMLNNFKPFMLQLLVS